MSDEHDDELAHVFSAMDARSKEIRSVRYVKAEDNLTDEHRRWEDEVQFRADIVRSWRIEGHWRAHTSWHTTFNDGYLYSWAMSDHDHFADLLEGRALHGARDRPRLPGVTREDIDERIALLGRVIKERRAWLLRQTKRERTR